MLFLIGQSFSFAFIAYLILILGATYPKDIKPLSGIKLRLFLYLWACSTVLTLLVEVSVHLIGFSKDMGSVLTVALCYFFGKSIRDWLVKRKIAKTTA